MFFDDLSSLTEIILNSNSIILSIPEDSDLQIKHPIHIYPEQTSESTMAKITVEQVRDVISMCSNKQSENLFFIFHQAHSLTEQAENSLLKLIEEPKDHYHFIFITNQPYLLLPTILSRSQIFILRESNPLSKRPETTDKILNLAKKLLTNTSHTELAELAAAIHKEKSSRLYALSLISTTIELAYKSYFATKNPKFLEKIPNFIKLYNNIEAGGNIQLQIIANLC